jgi:peptidoglycan/LPS O-acetylase OafA/YrhL
MDSARFRQAFSFTSNVRSLWDRPSERYAAIDGLRALSMLWVVLTHLSLVVSHFIPYDAYVGMMDRSAWLFSWVLHGEKALDTFFVISGFLIGGMLLSEKARKGRIDLRRFFARRYLRLMPAYAVALVLLLAVGVEREKAPYIWANILYVNNFLPQRHMFMDVSWSLAVEEQFYLIMPLFLLGLFFRMTRRAWLLGGLIALSIAIVAAVLSLHPNITKIGYGEHFIRCAPHYSAEYFDALYVNLYTRFSPFVFGFGLAWAIASHEARLRAAVGRHRFLADGLLVLGVLLLLGVIAVPVFDPHRTLPPSVLWVYIVFQRQVWSAGILLVMIGVLFAGSAFSRGVSSFLGARMWYPIAQLSYCSYLFHLGCVLPGLALATHFRRPGVPFLEAAASLRPSELLVGYLLTLVFSFLVGAFVYLAVERPFLNLRPR